MRFKKQLATAIILLALIGTASAQNSPPIAHDQSVELAEDTSKMITLTGSDPEGDALTYKIITRPSFGNFADGDIEEYDSTNPNNPLAVLNNPLTYTPYPWYAHYNGEDSFTFIASDGTSDSNVATVSLTILPEDDPPVLVEQDLVFAIKAEDISATKTYRLPTTEVDGDALIYSVNQNLPSFASLNPDTGELTLTFTHADIGAYPDVTFTVTDVTPAQLSDSYTGTITIREAQTYYLDATAPDGGSGMSWDNAWNSLSQAQDPVNGTQAGDTVLVRTGEYGEFAEGNTFRTDWTTYKADDGHKPVFTKMVLGLWGGPYDKYLHFDGFHILDGIRMNSPRHVVIEDCLIERVGPWNVSEEDIEKTAVSIRRGEDITVKDCEITRTAHGISAYGLNIRLINNHIHDIAHDGIRSTGLQDSLVEGNLIHGLDDGFDDGDPAVDWNRHCDGIHIFIMGSALPGIQNQNVVFRGNVIYDIESQGVQFNNYFRHPEVRNNNITFENNIFGPTRANVFNAVDPVDTLIFRNNSFIYFPEGREYVSQFRTLQLNNHVLRISESYTNVQVYNNILVDSSGGGDNATIFNWNLIQKPVSGAAYGRFTIIDTAQQFENPEAFDGRLLSTSSAINAGTRIFAPTAIYEYDREGRSRDNRPDMGAYEFPGQNPASETEPQQFPGTKTIFVDDFEDADFDADPWLEAESQQGLSWYHPVASSSQYEIKGDNAMPDPNNALAGPIEAGSSWLFSEQGSNWADYTLEFKAYTGYMEGGDGPVVLAVDPENYYWFDITRFDSDNPNTSGGRLVRFMTDGSGNPTETTLATNPDIATIHPNHYPYELERDYKIAVRHDAAGITFSVDAYNDGSVELTYTDNDPTAVAKFSAGKIGFHRDFPGRDHRLKYDNIKVTLSSQECVDMSALLNYISQWKQGQITMLSLMQKISLWKSEAGC